MMSLMTKGKHDILFLVLMSQLRCWRIYVYVQDDEILQFVSSILSKIFVTCNVFMRLDPNWDF